MQDVIGNSFFRGCLVDGFDKTGLDFLILKGFVHVPAAAKYFYPIGNSKSLAQFKRGTI